MLGDSIRISYQPAVVRLLTDRAHVVGPEENCQFSGHTLAQLDRWLARLGKPDVVHWNNGIHDVGHNPGRDPVQIPLDTYVADLRSILGVLRQTGAHIIWATTTPVHPKLPFNDRAWSWRNEEIDEYNSAATALMKSEGLAINDLHAVVVKDRDRLLSDDKLHLSEAGVQACAEAAAAAIEAALGRPAG